MPQGFCQGLLELGAGEVHDYTNDAGARVYWEFAGLLDLQEIEAEDLRHGVEVYSKMERSHPRKLVLPKQQVLAFWGEANGHCMAADRLGEDTASQGAVFDDEPSRRSW